SRNVVGGEPAINKDVHDIHKKCLNNWVRGCGKSVHVTNVRRIVQVYFEKPFHLGIAAISASLAIALIDQEFVVIQGKDFADAATVGKQIGVLVRDVAGGDIDGHDAQQVGSRATLGGILKQRVLHNTD